MARQRGPEPWASSLTGRPKCVTIRAIAMVAGSIKGLETWIGPAIIPAGVVCPNARERKGMTPGW